MWTAAYDSPGGTGDYVKAIAVDGDGNVYVAGESNNASWDYTIVKYNTSGVEQWATTYDGGSSGDWRGK